MSQSKDLTRRDVVKAAAQFHQGYTSHRGPRISPITFTASSKSLFLKRFLHPVMCEKPPLSA